MNKKIHQHLCRYIKRRYRKCLVFYLTRLGKGIFSINCFVVCTLKSKLPKEQNQTAQVKYHIQTATNQRRGPDKMNGYNLKDWWL